MLRWNCCFLSTCDDLTVYILTALLCKDLVLNTVIALIAIFVHRVCLHCSQVERWSTADSASIRLQRLHKLDAFGT